jgi:hypothetical protein
LVGISRTSTKKFLEVYDHLMQGFSFSLRLSRFAKQNQSANSVLRLYQAKNRVARMVNGKDICMTNLFQGLWMLNGEKISQEIGK